MDTQKMKDVFLTGGNEQAQKILAYLKNIGISDLDIWNYIGYYIVSVNPKEYEHALREGKKFACANDWGIYWINYYNERRGPIASSDIGYGILPQTLIPGEEKEQYADRRMWDHYDDHTPKTILEYFEVMKEYLGVTKIFRTYSIADNAITITPLSLDYERMSQLFKKFIEKYGYGPFEEVRELTFTGKLEEEPIDVKKNSR